MQQCAWATTNEHIAVGAPAQFGAGAQSWLCRWSDLWFVVDVHAWGGDACDGRQFSERTWVRRGLIWLRGSVGTAPR